MVRFTASFGYSEMITSTCNNNEAKYISSDIIVHANPTARRYSASVKRLGTWCNTGLMGVNPAQQLYTVMCCMPRV